MVKNYYIAKVVVVIQGGVAEVVERPDNVSVAIVDCDTDGVGERKVCNKECPYTKLYGKHLKH